MSACIFSSLNIAVASRQHCARYLVAVLEYFAYHVVLDDSAATGAGSCGGCDVPVCLVLNSINVVGKSNIGTRLLTTANAPGSNFITWQGGGVPVGRGVSGCPAATPTHRSAWGQLKALYRCTRAVRPPLSSRTRLPAERAR